MKKERNILAHFFLFIVSVACLLPLIMMIATTYNTEEELLTYGVKIFPKTVSFESYKIVFKNPQRIINAYAVTIFVTVVGTILDTIITSMVAYSLSRKNYRFQRFTNFYLYFTVLFNGGLIPTYWLITQVLGLKNSVWGLILPMLVSPWRIFLLRTFFKDIPSALFEAAQIDGASEFVTFWKIMLPLAKPALGTIMLMISLNYWNDWYSAMLYVDKAELTTLQLMLQRLTEYVNALKQMGSMSPGGVMAMVNIPDSGIMSVTCLIAAGPMLIVFLLFQKYFITGLTVGAVKE